LFVSPWISVVPGYNKSGPPPPPTGWDEDWSPRVSLPRPMLELGPPPPKTSSGTSRPRDGSPPPPTHPHPFWAENTVPATLELPRPPFPPRGETKHPMGPPDQNPSGSVTGNGVPPHKPSHSGPWSPAETRLPSPPPLGPRDPPRRRPADRYGGPVPIKKTPYPRPCAPNPAVGPRSSEPLSGPRRRPGFSRAQLVLVCPLSEQRRAVPRAIPGNPRKVGIRWGRRERPGMGRLAPCAWAKGKVPEGPPMCLVPGPPKTVYLSET